MALDEVIATAVRGKTQPPTLRLYGWDSVSLSLGCFQDLSGINLAYCRRRDITLVRRPTGGRAVLHDRELTYSFTSRTDRDPFSKGLLDSYRRIGIALHLALTKTGISSEARQERERGGALAGSPLCFQSSSLGEIMTDNRKLIGSAQKRWSDGLLQQGSIPYFHNLEEMGSVFGVEETTEMGARVAGIMEMAPGLSEDEFKGMLREAFEETFEIRFVQSVPSPAEVSLARVLEKEKYLQPRWNFHRGGEVG
jgi:lipoate-protein ligase A